MRFLLDTHLLLWAAATPGLLSQTAQDLINDPANDMFFSVASIWEIAIKASKGLPDFQVNAAHLRSELARNGYTELPIFGQHAAGVSGLQPIHKDPFDRLLVAQAMVEGIELLTADPVVARYPGPVRKV